MLVVSSHANSVSSIIMSIIKVRDLAKYGVLADVDPYELPVGAWSFGVNCRFTNGHIEHGPVWRAAGPIGTNPRFVFADRVAGGTDNLFVGYKNGRSRSGRTAPRPTTRSQATYTSSVEAQWTSCALANVVYVNRSDRAPWGLTPGGSLFTGVTGWDATWSAQIFRSYAGALVALNVTKSGINYPTLVKTSDIVTDPGVMPSTWDHTDPTTNAVENPLTELEGEIKDACVLGNMLVIYGTRQNFFMRADGGDDVYDFNRLPFDGGAINANCSVEVNGKHYVFGPDDIYVHDGITRESVVDQRNREFIYRTMDKSKTTRFFVQYNPNRMEIAFCYVGADQRTAFAGGTGCNRAAVLHVPTGRMNFDDLPFVHAGTSSAVALSSATWATQTATWATIGGSWQDRTDGFKKLPVYVGESKLHLFALDTLYANDAYGKNSLITAPVDEHATQTLLPRTRRHRPR
jgi:hypothetical protein